MKKISKDLRPHIQTPVAIVGMGRSGEAAKKLLLLGQIPAGDIATFDSKALGVDYSDAQDLLQNFRPRTMVVSPGVPLSTDWIQQAKNNGVRITSEISLACLCLENEKLIGVTGSVGKSTTVSLLGAGLQAFSQTGFVGGNLGTPFSIYAASVLEGQPRADWIILELSSYQLENCDGLNLEFSAITYLTPNHMERYSSLSEYYDTKLKIRSLTKNTLFLNTHGGDLIEYTTGKMNNAVPVSKEDAHLKSWNLSEARLIGQHNQDNIALATALAVSARWPSSAIKAMKEFGGLAHRLENLGYIDGVRYINDSKATAMDSVLIAAKAAEESQGPDGQIWILLGGRDKNLPWEQLQTLTSLTRCRFVFFGECRQIAQRKSALPGESYATLGDAIDWVKTQQEQGDTVLLSPGGTSLDEFKSFEARGDFFKKKVII